MVYRRIWQADTAQVVALWHEVFGDDDGFIRGSICSFSGEDGLMVAKEGETVCAILSAVPCEAQGQGGIYLYALATHPQCRGQGVMTELMRYTEQLARGAGRVFSVLIPASEALFAYYQKRGYSHTLKLRRWEIETGGDAPPLQPNVRIVPPEAKWLQGLRARWLPGPVVSFAGSACQAVAGDLNNSGAQMAITPFGYAVFYPPSEGKPALLAELAAYGDAEAMDVINAVRAHIGAQKMLATLPMAGLFAGQGRLCPAAVLKTLDDAYRPPEDLYLRFAMDAPGWPL